MDTVERGLYQGYMIFADNLEKQLVATYGHKKAKRLFQRMEQSRFEAIIEAASSDALKRQWLTWLEGCTRPLEGGKAGEAA